MNRRQAIFAGAGSAALSLTPFAHGSDQAIVRNGALALTDVTFPGGWRAPFLIDTGAEVTVVDRAALRLLDRETSRGLRVTVSGQHRTVTPELRDLAAISKALGQQVSGLLGCDFLSGFNVQLDYAAGALRLESGKMVKGAFANAMRFDGIPYLRAEVRVGGKVVAGEFGLDTGLDTGVKIFAGASGAAVTLGLRTVPGQTVTMSGARPQALARVDGLRIGGLDVLDLPASVSEDPKPRGAGSDTAGIIGAHALARRVLTLDFPGRWWFLSPSIL
jgi:hypothetical protein